MIKCDAAVLLPIRVVEGDGIHNIPVTLQSVQLLSGCSVPYFTSPVIASGYKTANRRKVRERGRIRGREGEQACEHS